MALLPPPDLGAAYVDEKSGQPSREFYNWVKSLYDSLRDVISKVSGIPVFSLPIGYGPAGLGVGGTVTQATNKTTGVTLNKICGQIITNSAALAANTSVAFVVTNSQMAPDDTVILSIKNEATPGSYLLQVCAVAGGSFAIHLRNTTVGNLSEAVIINFAIIKMVVS